MILELYVLKGGTTLDLKRKKIKNSENKNSEIN